MLSYGGIFFVLRNFLEGFLNPKGLKIFQLVIETVKWSLNYLNSYDVLLNCITLFIETQGAHTLLGTVIRLFIPFFVSLNLPKVT
jgi:hypothetical protein